MKKLTKILLGAFTCAFIVSSVTGCVDLFGNGEKQSIDSSQNHSFNEE